MQLSVSISYIFLLLLRHVHQLQTHFFSSPPDTVVSQRRRRQQQQQSAAPGGHLYFALKVAPSNASHWSSPHATPPPNATPPLPSLQQNARMIAVRFPVPLTTLHNLRADGFRTWGFSFCLEYSFVCAIFN